MHSDGDLQEHWKKTISNPNQYNPKSRLYNNNHNHNNNNTPRTRLQVPMCPRLHALHGTTGHGRCIISQWFHGLVCLCGWYDGNWTVTSALLYLTTIKDIS